MKKTIITVVGKDGVGIIAKVCTYLANNKINIEDISQTIVHGYFNMMMVVDMNESAKAFGEISSELKQIGEEIGVVISLQREEIFDALVEDVVQEAIDPSSVLVTGLKTLNAMLSPGYMPGRLYMYLGRYNAPCRRNFACKGL